MAHGTLTASAQTITPSNEAIIVRHYLNMKTTTTFVILPGHLKITSSRHRNITATFLVLVIALASPHMNAQGHMMVCEVVISIKSVRSKGTSHVRG
jgi:hypothetical protein